VGLTSQGANVIAGNSVISFRPIEKELSAFDHEVGPEYYEKIISPIVQSAVRKVLATYRWNDLDENHILEAQNKISDLASQQLQKFHLKIDSVALRNISLDSPKTFEEIISTSIEEQNAMKAKKEIEIAKQRAIALRSKATGIEKANRILQSSLSEQILRNRAQEEWTKLISSSKTSVKWIEPAISPTIEVNP
jgi:regulator of protease activity HflC (stomatin/prohibitin superfamily)